MKVVSERLLKNGKHRVTVDLAPGEQLMAVKPDELYLIGDQVDMRFYGWHLLGVKLTRFCPVIQEFVE